jgi:putative oxidoreductase
MNYFLSLLFLPVSGQTVEYIICFLRIALGMLMLGHGLGKIKGGATVWRSLGLAMGSFGVHWLPVMWGFLAACTEFFGGMAFVLGLGTRIASFFLIIVMCVALTMHIRKDDSFQIYSHALTLLLLFISFLILGSGNWSLDMWIYG